jgi:hypothetical protein
MRKQEQRNGKIGEVFSLSFHHFTPPICPSNLLADEEYTESSAPLKIVFIFINGLIMSLDGYLLLVKELA